MKGSFKEVYNKGSIIEFYNVGAVASTVVGGFGVWPVVSCWTCRG